MSQQKHQHQVLLIDDDNSAFGGSGYPRLVHVHGDKYDVVSDKEIDFVRMDRIQITDREQVGQCNMTVPAEERALNAAVKAVTGSGLSGCWDPRAFFNQFKESVQSKGGMPVYVATATSARAGVICPLVPDDCISSL
jgi:hypothetical protein